MARPRAPRRRRNKRQGTNVRVHMRKLQQAINNAVINVTPPSDPPRISTTRIFPIVTSVDVYTSATAGLSYSDIGTARLAVKPTTSGETITFKLTADEIREIYGKATSLSVASQWQTALYKVAIWGPLPNQAQTSVGLQLAYSSTYQSAATDQGTANSRPRVGFSIPQTVWTFGGNTTVIKGEILFGSAKVPEVGQLIGVLHISMAMRPNHV